MDRRGFLLNSLSASLLSAFAWPLKLFVHQPEMSWKTLVGKTWHGGWRLFETEGNVLFPVYGMSGGLTTRFIFYLIRPRADEQFDTIPVWIPQNEYVAVRHDNADGTILAEVMGTKIDAALKRNKFRTVRDGGDMGTPEMLNA